MHEPWPVLLLTGALGSGKTTVLRHLLNDPGMSGMAVLVNELGEIGLDHHLVERIDETIVLMRSGCLCCSLRGDLPQTLRHLERRWLAGAIKSLEGVVMETTGIADPGPILATLAGNPLVNRSFRLWLVATTVDASFGERQLDTRPEVARQAAAADVLLMTKTDLTDDSPPPGLLSRLASINPLAISLIARKGVFDVAALMRGPPPDRFAGDWPRHRTTPNCDAVGDIENVQSHGNIGALAFQAHDPVDWRALQAWLAQIVADHGSRLLRLKAILNVSGSRSPLILHGIHDTFYPPEALETWPGEDRSSRLVMIIEGFHAHSAIIADSARKSRIWDVEAGRPNSG